MAMHHVTIVCLGTNIQTRADFQPPENIPKFPVDMQPITNEYSRGNVELERGAKSGEAFCASVMFKRLPIRYL
jgi:hypothetical protein